MSSTAELRNTHEQGSTGGSSYVLVVDDELVVREFLTRCLERAGYSVKQASNAGEALEMMTVTAAGLVLCDIRMPGQDGLWLLERMRARWPQVPIVMVTGIDDLDTVRETRLRGALDYITKPIKPAQLLDVVKRVTALTLERTAMIEESVSAPSGSTPGDDEHSIEAEYTLETPLRCPACGERIATLKAVRLIRAHVNFTSTLPRRGRVLACPHCLSVLPAELTNF